MGGGGWGLELDWGLGSREGLGRNLESRAVRGGGHSKPNAQTASDNLQDGSSNCLFQT